MKRGFTIYKDSLSILDELTDEQAGKLLRAMRDFNNGKEPELESILRIAFAPFKAQFIREGIGVSELEISKINKANRNKGIKTKYDENDENDESAHKSIVLYSTVKVIVSYLNEKLNSTFSERRPNTIKHISARLNEGRTVDDFKKVIDTKISEWAGTEFAKHLKPDTLFGSKFEGYLNQGMIAKIEKTNKSKLVFDDNGNLITNKPY